MSSCCAFTCEELVAASVALRSTHLYLHVAVAKVAPDLNTFNVPFTSPQKNLPPLLDPPRLSQLAGRGFSDPSKP